MDPLFKYLPAQYANNLLDGEILFRNFVYFKKIEDDTRRDISEGTHIDAPDHDVEFTILSTGRIVSGRFAYHNTLEKPERVFCFCTSTICGPQLLKFGDTCIKIYDPDSFRHRLEMALKSRNRLSRLEQPFLLADQIKYFAVNREAPPLVDIQNPRHLPFLKRGSYSDEREFRFVFARRGGYKLKQMIVNEAYNEFEATENKAENHVILRIGSIRDIARRIAL